MHLSVVLLPVLLWQVFGQMSHHDLGCCGDTCRVWGGGHGQYSPIGLAWKLHAIHSRPISQGISTMALGALLSDEDGMTAWQESNLLIHLPITSLQAHRVYQHANEYTIECIFYFFTLLIVILVHFIIVSSIDTSLFCCFWSVYCMHARSCHLLYKNAFCEAVTSQANDTSVHQWWDICCHSTSYWA